MKISEHLSYEEATESPTAKKYGIKNEPDQAALHCMKAVALNCFEPARKWWGSPININSFFRSPELNKKINGKPGSQHQKGEAIDFSTGTIEGNKKLYDWMKANLIFDQLIWENGGAWIHVSFTTYKVNRNQAFDATQIIPK